MTKDGKNIKAIVEAGEVEKFDRIFFVEHGRNGVLKSWKISKKKRRERALKGWATRRSYPQNDL